MFLKFAFLFVYYLKLIKPGGAGKTGFINEHYYYYTHKNNKLYTSVDTGYFRYDFKFGCCAVTSTQY